MDVDAVGKAAAASARDSLVPWVEKYRPSSLSEIAAHEHIIDTVQRLVAEDRLPHLLFGAGRGLPGGLAHGGGGFLWALGLPRDVRGLLGEGCAEGRHVHLEGCLPCQTFILLRDSVLIHKMYPDTL